MRQADYQLCGITQTQIDTHTAELASSSQPNRRELVPRRIRINRLAGISRILQKYYPSIDILQYVQHLDAAA